MPLSRNSRPPWMPLSYDSHLLPWKASGTLEGVSIFDRDSEGGNWSLTKAPRGGYPFFTGTFPENYTPPPSNNKFWAVPYPLIVTFVATRSQSSWLILAIRGFLFSEVITPKRRTLVGSWTEVCLLNVLWMNCQNGHKFSEVVKLNPTTYCWSLRTFIDLEIVGKLLGNDLESLEVTVIWMVRRKSMLFTPILLGNFTCQVSCVQTTFLKLFLKWNSWFFELLWNLSNCLTIQQFI